MPQKQQSVTILIENRNYDFTNFVKSKMTEYISNVPVKQISYSIVKNFSNRLIYAPNRKFYIYYTLNPTEISESNLWQILMFHFVNYFESHINVAVGDEKENLLKFSKVWKTVWFKYSIFKLIKEEFSSSLPSV
jgi:hypothetical protein